MSSAPILYNSGSIKLSCDHVKPRRKLFFHYIDFCIDFSDTGIHTHKETIQFDKKRKENKYLVPSIYQ
jgi:hypothetical protein